MRVRAPADDLESSFGGDLGREIGQMPPRNPPPAWRDAVLVERCEDAVDVVFDGGFVGLRMPQVLVPVHFDGMPFGYGSFEQAGVLLHPLSKHEERRLHAA